MDNPIVSVIIPIYNVEDYLRRCVDSVLAQTHTGLEVILVDDGSPDSCPQICDEYAGKDNRIKVIHQQNAGLGGARNAGLDAAKGDYLAFVDSDDWIAPEMVERLLSALLQENADMSICGFQRVDENTLPRGEKNSFPLCVLSGMSTLEKLYTPDYQYFTIACNKLFKRALFDTIRFPAGKLFEDGYAAFRYYYKSKRVVCLPDCFYFYLTRINSITTAALTVKNLDGLDAEVDSIDFLAEKGCTDLVVKAQTKYVAAIINNLRRFDLKQKDIRLKFKAVNRDFRRLYAGIMKNTVLSKKEKLLISLFGLSPRLCKLAIQVKKLLLIIWNFLFDTAAKLVDALFLLRDFFYRHFVLPPKVMTNAETIDYILKTHCCVSRYGDAEIKLAAGNKVFYQEADPRLVEKLRQVLVYDDKRLLVCLPNAFESLSHFTPEDGRYWKKHLSRYRKRWYRYTLKNKTYGNAFISRVYMCFNEKDKAQEYFDALKQIWDGTDVVLVEGEKSRLGVGNDLFDNARSVRRILGPSAQAFSQYENLLNEVKKLEKSALIILAMGPIATVMPYDLLGDGYRAIDLGNIDTEYEWFLRGCTKKTPIENKMVYEAGAGEGVGELDDEVYQAQIIAKVTG